MSVTILGIESSCDDTSAAIIQDGFILSNIVSNQEVHKAFGGVVPELASRAHQQNIIPAVEQAMKVAGVSKKDITAVAFTSGPGLLGSLLVGTSFSKGFALAAGIPLIEINHLQAHILVHFIKDRTREIPSPGFPFLCLLVSGGHTQIVVVRDYLDMEIIGQTIDDAAGEAFDKCAKIMGLPYPGGPWVDKHAKEGSAVFSFSKPFVKDLDFSFSGLKTSFLYFVRDQIKKNPEFIAENLKNLCASIQGSIIEILTDNLIKASKQTGIKRIALAGGVSANSGLRNKLNEISEKHNWQVYIPEFRFTTDNAAMIAITGYHKYLTGEFSQLDAIPFARHRI